MNTDCIIIGAGPTGLTLGLCLLKQGKSVVIIEKHELSLDFSKAVLIHSDTLRILEPYGVSPLLRNCGARVSGVSFFIRQNLVSQVKFDSESLDSYHPIFLPQQETESCIMKIFQELGGKIIKGYKVDTGGIIEKSDQVVITASPNNLEPNRGEDITITSNWLFGCDGYHSVVRDYLNLSFTGDSLVEEPFSADIEIENWPYETNMCTYLFVDGICNAFLLKTNKARISAPNQALLDVLISYFPVKAILWKSAFNVQFKTVDTYGAKNIWLAGDSAHVQGPAGGRGMNLGISDAIHLSESIKINDLSRYQSDRLPVATQWVKKNRMMTLMSNSQKLYIKLIRGILMFFVPLFDWIYGSSKFAQMLFVSLTGVKVKTCVKKTNI